LLLGALLVLILPILVLLTTLASLFRALVRFILLRGALRITLLLLRGALLCSLLLLILALLLLRLLTLLCLIALLFLFVATSFLVCLSFVFLFLRFLASVLPAAAAPLRARDACGADEYREGKRCRSGETLVINFH
jgi:hypothetical protein